MIAISQGDRNLRIELATVGVQAERVQKRTRVDVACIGGGFGRGARGGGSRRLTERIDAVVNCIPIRVKIKSKLTNFEINSQIEGYNGK